MFFMLAIIMMLFGLIMAGLFNILPIEMVLGLPPMTGYMLFTFGIVISFVGILMLYMRASKTGAAMLIRPASPDKILWFYVYKDGSMKILPAVRDVEGFTHSKRLDAEIQDIAAYRLFDHSVRIVPEGIGHSVDLGACLYGYFLKDKHGFKSINEARKKALLKEGYTDVGVEHQADGSNLDKYLENTYGKNQANY